MTDFSAPGAAGASPLLQQGLQAAGQGRMLDAIDLLERAVAERPKSTDSRYHLARTLNEHALALVQLGRLDEALSFTQRSGAVDATDIDAANIEGYILLNLGREAEAVEAYSRAARINPRSADIWFNLATVLMNSRRPDEAEEAFGRVIALVPDHFAAIVNRGFCRTQAGRAADAAESFEAALRLQPDDPGLKMALLASRTSCCDWRDHDALREAVRAGLLAAAAPEPAAGRVILEPFESLALYDDPELHRICAEAATNAVTGGARPAPPRRAPASGKIRLGYLSADYHSHAIAYLMAEVFARHDHDRFELIALSVGAKVDDMTAHLQPFFDGFHHVGQVPQAELTALIERENIEILVDLGGFAGMGHTAALAGRPAPIQVNYLGFPGTLGADFIDYIIGDPWVTPPGSERFYTEKVVRLPHSYQPNSLRATAVPLARAAYGLPEQAVVFCCFNSSFKITPTVFSAWMRILQAVPGSVMWLLEGSEVVARNLRSEAQARGVDADRLVFADFAPRAEHIARLALADVVLDTTPYNAHTTCSDALWAGVPVVTCAGPTFAGRVAASLVNAAGVPELNRPSWQDYEAFAVALGRDPAAVRAWKDRLLKLRETSPLFDVAAFTRDLEAAYVKMSKRWRAGLPPEGFDA